MIRQAGILVTNISHPKQLSVALNTRAIASCIVMKYRVISISVIGRGFQLIRRSLKNGIIDPLVPMTFPARIQTNFVSECSLFACMMIFSQSDLQLPYTLIGLHALSVDTSITTCTLFALAALTTFSVQVTFVLILSSG